MKKGQAGALIGIIALILIIVAVVVLFVFVLNPQSSAPEYQYTSESWCLPGNSEYYNGAYATVEGIENFQGQYLCKAVLTYAGETGYIYFNEATTVWYITDTYGTILESSSGTSTSQVEYPPTQSASTNIELEHGQLMDFIGAVKLTDESQFPECDLEETPFSAELGMAGGAGLRSCNGAEIEDLGVRSLSQLSASDVGTGSKSKNPSAIVGHSYIVELRDGGFVALEISAVSSDQNTVSFEWKYLSTDSTGEIEEPDYTISSNGLDACGCSMDETPVSGCSSTDSFGLMTVCGTVVNDGETVCRIIISDGTYYVVAYERDNPNAAGQLVYYTNCAGDPMSYEEATRIIGLMEEY